MSKITYPKLVKAIAFKGEKGDTLVSVAVGQTVTGEAGTAANVENVGTETEAVLKFTIPRGNTGVSITSIAKTASTGYVDTYTITMSDGSTYTFEVRNGEHKQEYITQAEYNALVEAGTVQVDTYYFITDDTTADDLADEIDALQSDVGSLQTDVGGLQTDVAGLQSDVNDHASYISSLETSMQDDVLPVTETLDFSGGDTDFVTAAQCTNQNITHAALSKGLYLLQVYDQTVTSKKKAAVMIYISRAANETIDTPIFNFYAYYSASGTIKHEDCYVTADSYGHLYLYSNSSVQFSNYIILAKKIGV